MSQKQSTGLRRGRGALLAAVAVLALVWYASGGLWEYRGEKDADGEIARNRAELAALERQTPIDPQAEMRRLYLERLNARQGIMVDDLEAEQRRILALDPSTVSKADVARWFANTAIVGDSIIQSADDYKWLTSPPVVAKGGVHLSVELELFDAVEALRPSVIFLCFGMNDVGVFKDRVDRYVDRYSACIRRLQRNLPDAVIYVQGALPVTDRATYEMILQYNEAMRQACPELGAYYVDPGFIIREQPNLLNVDGSHPRKEYYPLWLTFLADVAGLSYDR